jgi:lipopolysaccharide biosynthesis glycosyltransferase
VTKRAILTGCDMNYMPGAAALLRSVARHHPNVARYCIVPDRDKVSAEHALAGLATVITPPRPIRGLAERMQVAYGKIFMPLLVPHETTLWLDSDIVVCRPIDELFAVVSGHVRAVCSTPHGKVTHNLPLKLRTRFEDLCPQASREAGFNGGVFALRPTDWPDLVEKIEQMIADLGWSTTDIFYEQALLNHLFLGKIDYLPMEYNWTELFDKPPPSSVRVVHFASKPKPWMPGYPKHEPGYWFWVRHGMPRASLSQRMAIRTWVWLNTPRRHISRLIRKVRGKNDQSSDQRCL